MIEGELLEYSSEGLLNRVEFYKGYNDINLYVEDENSQYLYETIFKRLLGDRYAIKTIFPCGGKINVKKAFEEYGEQNEDIKNVYVVDGDFDEFLFPERMVLNSHFVYLKMYNIESCIINEEGLCSIVKGKLKCVDIEAREKLDYKGWRNRIINEAKELFFCYCYIQKYEPSYPNIQRSHYTFLDYRTGFKRTDGSFEKYQDEVYNLHSDAKDKIDELKIRYEQKYEKHYDRLICGKFLISSIHDYLKSITKCSIEKDDILWQMANSFDVSVLDYVKEACIGN